VADVSTAVLACVTHCNGLRDLAIELRRTLLRRSTRHLRAFIFEAFSARISWYLAT
jgi:hypothetical protein